MFEGRKWGLRPFPFLKQISGHQQPASQPRPAGNVEPLPVGATQGLELFPTSLSMPHWFRITSGRYTLKHSAGSPRKSWPVASGGTVTVRVTGSKL